MLEPLNVEPVITFRPQSDTGISKHAPMQALGQSTGLPDDQLKREYALLGDLGKLAVKCKFILREYNLTPFTISDAYKVCV